MTDEVFQERVLLELQHIREKVESIETDVGSLKSDVGSLKSDVGSLKSDVGSLKSDVGSLKAAVGRQAELLDDFRKSTQASFEGVQAQLAIVIKLHELTDRRLDRMEARDDEFDARLRRGGL